VCEQGKCVEHCPSGWWESQVRGKCYQGGGHVESWSAAATACTEMNAHLATLASAEEETALRAAMGDRLVPYWLGATDEGDEGQWRWVTGEPWDRENWCDGAPDNLDGSEHWLLWDAQAGCWDDAPATASPGHRYICELD